MSDDVVKRYNGARPIQAPAQLLADAIREVEVLREENKRLREALKPFAEKEHAYEGWADIARAEVWLNVRDIRAAATAIREGAENA